MKQNITPEQWDEITDKQKKKLDNYGDEELYLTIGQMIEFLSEEQDNGSKKITWLMLSKGEHQWYLGTFGNPLEDIEGFFIDTPELCNALWEAVKEVLKTK